MDKFQIFDVISMNDEMEEEFHAFFYKYNLTPLFTNEHRAGQIRVSDNEMRSVVNENGKAHKVLKDFSDYLLMAQNNKSYEEAIFKIIYESRSLQGLVNKIKRLMEYIDSIIDERKFNTWNIVFYTKEVY